jgi:hypothetical protein
MARKAGILLVVAALVGSAVTAAAPADADTVVDLSGSAPAGTHGPGAFTVEYDIYAAGDLPSAVLTTHQDSALPALAGAVTLDGTAVPDAHVSSPDPGDLSIALGTDPSGTLPGGSHIVTFTVTVGTGDTTDTSSDATLTWGDSGTVTSEPVKVEVNQPDVYSYLTAGDDAAPAAARAGSFTPAKIEDTFMVSNQGWGAPNTQVEVKVPRDLTIVSLRPQYNDARRTSSAPVRDAEVNLGPITHSEFVAVVVVLKTTPQERVGHRVTVKFRARLLSGQGTDADPANNDSTDSFTITGPAALTEHIIVPTAPVHVGDRLKVTERIHNRGPNAAVTTLGTVLADSHFKIVSFSARMGAHSGHGEIFWHIGRLAAGSSATAVLVLKALTAASQSHPAQLQLWGQSHNVNPRCPEGNCGPAQQSLVIHN